MLAAVITRGEEILGVAHLGRRPTAAPHTALEWLHPRCANQPVTVSPAWSSTTETTGPTPTSLVDVMDRLCPQDHALKTYQGWSLVQGRGRRARVSPDHSRHPGHAGAGRAPPAA